jgi:predicted lipoprotein with Yx(FWY)xxD motif
MKGGLMTKRITILAALLAMAIAGTALAAGTGRSVRVVSTAKNASLGETVLVNMTGRTLYSLSVERKGKFICTNKACLSFWHPLVVGKGVTPAGAAALATVKRPDGRRQVTYRGRPLYTFAGDRARGDAKGEGFMDVGVWHAATPGTASAPAPATTTSSGGGYRY